MAISRLGRTAVAVSGLAALAGVVIWFGILKREGGSGSAPSETAVSSAPPASPDAAAPRPAEPDASRVARTADPAASTPPSPREPAGTPPSAARPPDAPAASPARPSGIAPSFDIVRVEPSGESVIAGRTAPGAIVELLRSGKPHARIAADDSGLFAFVPPPFPPGSHEIVLESTAPDGTRARSRETVTIAIAEKKDTKPLVALTTPDRPTVVLSEPEPPASAQAAVKPPEPQARTAAAPDPAKAEPKPPASAPPPPAAAGPRSPVPSAPAPQPGAAPSAAAQPPAALQPAPPAPAPSRPRSQVRIASVEAEEGGRLFVSGQAAPGATVRLYLNETMIAPGGAGADGRIAFAIGRGVRPGSYRVRLDDVDPVSGEVKSRAEVEFRVPAPLTVELPPAAQPYITRPAEPAPPARVAAAPPDAQSSGGSGAARAPTEAPGPPPAQEAAAPQPRAGSAPPAGPGAPPPHSAPAAERAPTPAPGDPAGAERSPSTTASAVQRQLDANTVMIPEVNTAIVSRGENLWRISRRVYGRGVRYTVIYNANEEQIGNPNLIYPGQVFVLPAESAADAPR